MASEIDSALGLYPFCFFLCVFCSFLGRALLQGGISARNICLLFRADLFPLLLAKMCQLFLFLFCPLDFCSSCGFCSLCAPDTTFSALCTALTMYSAYGYYDTVVFTAFTTSRFMCWVFRCRCACLYGYVCLQITDNRLFKHFAEVPGVLLPLLK